jgi:hypothetical protein
MVRVPTLNSAIRGDTSPGTLRPSVLVVSTVPLPDGVGAH